MDDTTGSQLRLVALPSGQTVEVRGASLLVGRHSEADLRLPMPDVSRRHCRFMFRDGLWRVIDLASTNGTFVNGRRIDEAELREGDRVRIAGFEFEFPGEADLENRWRDSLSRSTRKAS